MSPRYLALLALGVLLFGCASAPSSKEAFLSSIEKAGKLSSLVSETQMNVTSAFPGGSSFSSASVVQYMEEGKSRSDLRISGIPELEGREMRVYSLGGKTYLCQKAEAWSCLEVNSSIGMSGETLTGFGWFLEKGKSYVDSGAVEFTGGVGRREFLGRGCSVVSGNVNYSKAGDPAIPKGVKLASFSECLDDELGIALQGKVVVEEETGEGRAVSQAEMQIIRLEPNGAIPESTFELPAK